MLLFSSTLKKNVEVRDWLELPLFVSKEEYPLGFARNIGQGGVRPSEPLERSQPGSVQRRSCLR